MAGHWQQISTDEIPPLLAHLGLVAPGTPVQVEPLGGGVSNVVLKLTAGAWRGVLKQALPRLRVAEEWLADPSRVLREAAALRAVGRLLAPGEVPAVLAEEPARYAVVISCAPDTARPWKARLMAGEVRLEVAAAVGDLLARLHRATWGPMPLAPEWADLTAFRQLRLDPYYGAVAARHPDVRQAVEAAAAALEGPGQALVHGDFSPKNILVDDHGGQPRLVLLDFEVVHHGQPEFDVAFCLNHLLLKAIYFAPAHQPYLEAARRLWHSYAAPWPPDQAAQLERKAIPQLGCLLLARVDGKSPVEYLTREEQREQVRRLGKALLLEGACSLEEVWSRVEAVLDRRAKSAG